MTPEKLDEARAKEAVRIWSSQPLPSGEVSAPAAIAARLAREGWTPPKPVDPDLLAFREFASKAARSASLAESYRDGGMDSCISAHLFLAGARMARERFAPREREMLAVLEDFCRDCDGYLDGDGHPWALLQRARDIIAKHKEEKA